MKLVIDFKGFKLWDKSMKPTLVNLPQHPSTVFTAKTLNANIDVSILGSCDSALYTIGAPPFSSHIKHECPFEPLRVNIAWRCGDARVWSAESYVLINVKIKRCWANSSLVSRYTRVVHTIGLKIRWNNIYTHHRRMHIFSHGGTCECPTRQEIEQISRNDARILHSDIIRMQRQ